MEVAPRRRAAAASGGSGGGVAGVGKGPAAAGELEGVEGVLPWPLARVGRRRGASATGVGSGG